MSDIIDKLNSKSTASPSITPPGFPVNGMDLCLQAWGSVGEYMIDATQRTILFWDLMRQRSDQYYAQKAKAVPHVLNFESEVILDARTFERPVNYGLVRIKPPQGVTVDPRKRPFVVVDPRA